ncbi:MULTISPECIES: serine hydrolase [unclassified Streptomyces]|uniref:D-alanyl-D-alanine carboxypeptidase family protein n=1 Tax=unclassified Streptomyces TaxID=2593676 RepID=UPI000DB91543|nr:MULTISPECIES: serine hydrolase [unclassified Streptomyces]MYT68666.1 D-alanyl-D-alanine carboxypeptidase [Streptomyces sp. SID8367]RAJ86338.1 D-alanyl-D-alanine carboxypeptidase (penicillin-binding protein 5/6) [Streptomyces sp. PsTaAH-137]
MPGTASSPQQPSSSRFSRRAALGLGAGAAAALALPAQRASAAQVVGGARLGASGVQVRRGAGAPKVPGLKARAWLVADNDSGEVLASYNAHKALAPASTLKMLFADTVLPKFHSTDKHKVTAADLAGIPYGSSLVGIQAGTTYTVHQLWQGVFLRSGNDAVHVLAHMNGGVDETVAQMQARAADLQAGDTHVVSPDGFDHKGQLSSAYDLTLFARAGLKNDDFRGYCSTRVADFPAGGSKTFQIQNTDRLLTGQGVTPYRGLIGVKNGYTTNAGNTFTGAATRDGRTLLVTVMHPGAGAEVYEETAALLDWGFSAWARVSAVGELVVPLSEQPRSSASPAAGALASGGGSGSAEHREEWALGGSAAVAALAGGSLLALRRRRPTGRRRA